MPGYRFVSGHIVQITSEEEIVAIEQALALPDSLKPVREHLRQSLMLLADRKAPDYRNSIKESISAIESLSKIISGLPKATLNPALNTVEKKTALHPVLKEAFQKLYGYTSDAQGTRIFAHCVEQTAHIHTTLGKLRQAASFGGLTVEHKTYGLG
jgi:hypothetical protein